MAVSLLPEPHLGEVNPVTIYTVAVRTPEITVAQLKNLIDQLVAAGAIIELIQKQ